MMNSTASLSFRGLMTTIRQNLQQSNGEVKPDGEAGEERKATQTAD